MQNRSQTNKELQHRFNGTHIHKEFGLVREEIGRGKRLFEESFGGEDQYRDFVLGRSLEEIVEEFRRRVIEKGLLR